MSNFISVNMPTSQAQFNRVYSVSYMQENYKHDYALVQFRDPQSAPRFIKPGAPIQLQIEGKNFHGYIHDIQGERNNNVNITRIGVIGASYVMRQGSQEVYKNVTADQVIISIAKKYGFAYKTTPHPRVYPQLSQAGMTDWEFMVKLAKQSGYFLRAEDTVLHFHPFLEEFEALALEAPIYTQTNAGFKYKNILYSFKPVVGETLAHHGADKSATSIAGVNPETGEYFKYTKQKRDPSTRTISNPEFFDKHATHVVANNYSTAVSEAISADQKSVFPYVAEAEVLGSSTLRPGMPIYLDNLGEEYSGYWTVLSVNHKIVEKNVNTQLFTSIITVGTDSLGATASMTTPERPPVKPIRHIIPNVRNTRIIPQTKLKLAGVQVRPIVKSGLINRTNRSDKLKGTSTAASVNKAVWVSTDGNLNSRPPKPSRSLATRIKVYSNVARS